MNADGQDTVSVDSIFNMVSELRTKVRTLQTARDNESDALAQQLQEFRDLCRELHDVRRSEASTVGTLDGSPLTGRMTTPYTTKSFEQFMKHEVCFLSERRPAVYFFLQQASTFMP